MKNQIWAIIALCISIFGFQSCQEDKVKEGAPIMSQITIPANAFFGDSIPFSVHVDDRDQVALSTVKLQLAYGDVNVQQVVMRTKTPGTYSGKIYAPFMKDVPDGTATVKFILQNVSMTKSEQIVELPLSRPDFTNLILIKANGDEVIMNRISKNNYSATASFDQKQKAFIKAPAFGKNGNDLFFGWSSGEIKEGSKGRIPFSSMKAGVYAISFNTQSFAAAPFLTVKFDGVEMSMIDDITYKVEKNLTNGSLIEIENILGYDEFWIDPSYFKKEGNKLKFITTTGKYRVTADLDKKYFKVQIMTGDQLSTLSANGEGAIYILGGGVGVPNLKNEPGWSPGRGLQLPMISPKIFQLSFVAGIASDGIVGQTISAKSIDFKFFHQDGWGGEFGGKSISLAPGTDLIKITDSGNITLALGKELEVGATYQITVDVSAGNDAAKLSFIKK